MRRVRVVWSAKGAISRTRAVAVTSGALWNIHHGLALLGAGQGRHRLSGAEDLSDLGAAHRDDAVEIRVQLGIAHLVARPLQVRLRLGDAGLGRVPARHGGVELRLGDVAAGQQAPAPRFRGAGVLGLRPGVGEVRLGTGQGEARHHGIEGRDALALVDDVAHRDVAGDHPAGDLEADLRLVARGHDPGEGAEDLGRDRLHDPVQHRPHGRRRRRLLGGLAGPEGKDERQGVQGRTKQGWREQGWADHRAASRVCATATVWPGRRSWIPAMTTSSPGSTPPFSAMVLGP
jgi:hypothetical protein